MARSYSRGHEIEYYNNRWVYIDNGKPIDNNRPCKKCGGEPTAEGYDKCIGHIEGASSACCGHGVEEPYTVMNKDSNKKALNVPTLIINKESKDDSEYERSLRDIMLRTAEGLGIRIVKEEDVVILDHTPCHTSHREPSTETLQNDDPIHE